MPPNNQNPCAAGSNAGAKEFPIFSTERDGLYLSRLARFGKVEYGANTDVVHCING